MISQIHEVVLFISSSFAAVKPLEYSQAQFDTGGQKKWNKPIKSQSYYTTENTPELTLKAHKATCLLTCIIALLLWNDLEVMWNVIPKSCTGIFSAQLCLIWYLHGEVQLGTSHKMLEHALVLPETKR